jgi:hypothetical protein
MNLFEKKLEPKKSFNFWKAIVIVICLFILIIIIIISFLIYFIFFAGVSKPAKDVVIPVLKDNVYEYINANNGNFLPDEIINSVDVSEGQVEYVLYELEAYELHSAPFSSELPEIEVSIDGEVYTVNIDEGEIIATEGAALNEDLTFYTTKRALVEAIISDDVSQSVVSSVREGESYIELETGQSELALKGYIGLYKKLYPEGVDLSPKLSSGISWVFILIVLVVVVLVVIYYKKKR